MLEHETESGSNTSLLLSQNSPSTTTLSSPVTRNTELLLSSRSRPLSQQRGLSSQTSTENPTEQSTTKRKPVHNREKNKTVKNWKERKVQVNPNQFTIKELWERKSRALRNDQLKEQQYVVCSRRICQGEKHIAICNFH